MSALRFDPGFARTLALVHTRANGESEIHDAIRRVPAPPNVGDCAMTVEDFIRYAQGRLMRQRAAAERLESGAATQLPMEAR